MKPWTRDHTKTWIAQLELRAEDLDYYLNETIRWCEDNDVYDDRTVFACAMMTVLWVTWQRDEVITRWELMEILGIKDWDLIPDEVIELGPKFHHMDLSEILPEVANWQ